MTVHQQLITNQGFLECGRHESITRTGVGEDGEVDPEEEEVKDQRKNNETSNPGEEVFNDTLLCCVSEKLLSGGPNTYIVGFPPVQEVPKVDHDSDTDGHDGKDSIDLGRPGASHEESGSKHPSPPIECEFAVGSSECVHYRGYRLCTHW